MQLLTWLNKDPQEKHFNGPDGLDGGLIGLTGLFGLTVTGFIVFICSGILK